MSGRPARLQLPIFLAAASLLLVHALWYRAYVSDDAYISLRYARRFLNGEGLTWTDGERVEGYSNLAWLLACALLGRLGLDLLVAARVLGLFCMSWALWILVRSQRGWAAMALAALSFAVAGPIAVWTVGGLEAPMQAAFLAWGVSETFSLAEESHGRRALRAGLPLLGLVLTRPDGWVLAAGLAAAVWLLLRTLRPVACLLAPAAVATVAQQLFRLAYYHSWLPNTAWSKLRLSSATLRAGVVYLGQGALSGSGLLVLAAVGLALGERRRVVVIGLPLAAWLAYVATVGGDFMPAHRHLVPALVLLAFAAGEAGATAARFGRDGKIRLALLSTVSLTWFGATQLFDPENLFAHAQTWASDGARLGELFRRGLGDRRPLLALDAAGSIAYASGLPSLDMLGLCDAWIAHHPPPVGAHELVGHSLGDGDYVLRREPDLVVFRGPEGGEPMFTYGSQMRADPRFAQYDLVTFAADALRSKVFVRRHGRAGILPGAPLRVPGWLFATVPGNLARLDGAGRLEGELRAPAVVATGHAGAHLAALEPADAAVTIEIASDGAVTARPVGAGPAHLRAVVVR